MDVRWSAFLGSMPGVQRPDPERKGHVMHAGVALAIINLNLHREDQRKPPASGDADHPAITAHPTAADSQTRVERARADDGSQTPPTADG